MTSTTVRPRPPADRVSAARADPAAFAELCFPGSRGEPARLANVHRELHAFLSAHPQAVVELPRDHGKSFQACARVLWELGREPGLRVKVVCATEAVAAERSRFLRDAIAGNPYVQKVFPHLKPGEPWAADAFTIRRPADVIGPSVAAFGVGAGAGAPRADAERGDARADRLGRPGERERGRGPRRAPPQRGEHLADQGV
ncbi:MAG TPA: hypothetical protein VM529_26795, partial [Gemmata sp.]|nr:hypothetical protein [Gemmata sp.]